MPRPSTRRSTRASPVAPGPALGRRQGAGGGDGAIGGQKRNSSANTAATTTDASMIANDTVIKLKTSKGCAQGWSNLLRLAAGRRTNHSNLLLTREQQQQQPTHTTATKNNITDDTTSLFDCSDLIIPPAYELINLEVAQGIKRWEDLASRVIVDEGGDGDDYYAYGEEADGDNGGEKFAANDGDVEEEEEDEGGKSLPKLRNRELLLDATSRGDKRKQRLLPYNFDYACKTTGPGTGDVSEETNAMAVLGEDGGDSCQKKQKRAKRLNHQYRPRVISLLDPTQTCDYEEELWKVFRSVKTLDELECEHALGERKDAAATLDTGKNTGHDGNCSSVPSHGCRHTLAVKDNMKEWLAKYSRMDAHSLGRLRIRDRHSNPLRYPITDYATTASTSTSKSRGGISHANYTTSTTLRFEIHRHSQPLKRGSGPDANRLEVELHGHHHTLFDLHRLLVEFALNKVSSCNDDEEDDDNTTAAVGGVFFIENVFYTCGTDGKKVREAIVNWLDGKKTELGEENESTDAAEVEAISLLRREYLGLMSSSITNNATIPMVEMRLEDLPIRLGVRFFHMFVPPPIPLFQHLLDEHASSSSSSSSWCLSTESAVYVTGIHTHISGSGYDATTKNEENMEKGTKEGRHIPPILVHDAWSPPLRHVCHACQHAHASIVTVDDELTDAPPPGLESTTERVHLWGVPMCSSCFRALHYRPARIRCGKDSDDDNRGELGASNDREESNGDSENSGNDDMKRHSSLELRPGCGPSLVFPIEDYQRMVTSSEYRING